jgi:hypothetical protein
MHGIRYARRVIVAMRSRQQHERKATHMTAAEGPPDREEIARTWGGHFTFTYESDEHSGEPHCATRKDGKGVVRAATRAELLDKIKDALSSDPFTQDTGPSRQEERC